MTGTTSEDVAPGPAHDDVPPPGTAIVRPLRHVRTVREHYLRRFTDPAAAAASRSARAWSWALGETPTAPVTDHQTTTPPSRLDIEAEITEADRRRLHGDRSSRADAAAVILRWLIGHDDHVPVRTANRGELVGGFGDVVRSPDQIATVLALAAGRQGQASVTLLDSQNTDYLDGIVATLSWALGEQPAPVSRTHSDQWTARILKTERMHAEDIVQHAGRAHDKARSLSARYAEGVEHGGTASPGCSVTRYLRRPNHCADGLPDDNEVGASVM